MQQLPIHPHVAKQDQSHREGCGRGEGRKTDSQGLPSYWGSCGSTWWPLGETHSGECLEGSADPMPAPSPAPHTPSFQQGDAGEGVSGWEPQWFRAPLSLSCLCTGVGTASGCLKGLLCTLLLRKLEHDSTLN